MDYYILSINNDNSLWKKYSTISPFFYDRNGVDVDVGEGLNWTDLFYKRISNGSIAPVEELDGFILMNQSINNIELLGKPGELELIPICDLNNANPYLILNVINRLSDSIDWVRSEFEAWPSDKKNFQEWEHVRGQVFYKPVVFKSKIPDGIDIFLISDWPDNNVVVSEAMRRKIIDLDFDKRFLKFTLLDIV